MKFEFFLTYIVVLSCWSCRNNPSAPEQTPTALQITTKTSVVFSGQQIQLSAIVALKDGSSKDVTTQAIWSNQPGIAGRVNQQGEFTAFTGQTGTETIRAEFQGQTATTIIDVTKRAEILSIVPVNLNIGVGESVQFEAIAQFEDNTQDFVTEQVTWSLTPGIAAEIDDKGLFRAFRGNICDLPDDLATSVNGFRLAKSMP